MAAEGEGSTATALARGPNLSFGSFSALFFRLFQGGQSRTQFSQLRFSLF